MKVLVATALTQGARSNDYHWAIEGELVRVDEPCRTDIDDADGDCGCGRGFAGLNSARATTTAVVAEVPLSPDDYVMALGSSYDQQGYDMDDDLVRDMAEFLSGCVASLPAGTILERRVWHLHVRSVPELAGDTA